MDLLEWAQGMRKDALQLSNRLQTIIRFQIAADVQIFLDRILPVTTQLPAIALCIACLELGVRQFGLYSLSLLRAVVVIQSGQCLLRYIDSIDQYDVGTSYTLTHVTSWLITTATLCVPGMFGATLRSNAYISNAVTVFLYQYTDATRSIVTLVDLGVSPLFVAVLCVILAVRVRHWNAADANLQNTSLYVYFFKAFHMLIVELLLFSLQRLTLHLNAFLQVMLQMIVVLSIDALNRQNLLEEVRGYAIWRLSRMLLSLKFEQVASFDAMMTSALASLIFLSRRIPWIHNLYTTAQSVHTLAEIVFLASMNLILRPITSDVNHDMASQLLLILLISTVAQSVEYLFSDSTSQFH